MNVNKRKYYYAIKLQRKLKKIADGTVTDIAIRQLLQKQNELCALCAKPIPTCFDYTRDHIIPISRGGKHTMSNIQLTCWPCNANKGNTIAWKDMVRLYDQELDGILLRVFNRTKRPHANTTPTLVQSIYSNHTGLL